MNLRAALIVFTALWCEGALAAPPKVTLAECDANGDGALDRGEISGCVTKLDAKVMASSPKTAAQCDRDNNKTIDQEEARDCFYALDASARKSAKASDAWTISEEAAVGLMGVAPGGRPTIEAAQGQLDERRIRDAKQEPLTIGSPFLTIGRKLTDAVDPRAAESSVPFIVSFSDDRDADDDAFVALGAVTYLVSARDIGAWSQHWYVSVDADVTTKNAPFDSSLGFSAPLSWSWANGGRHPWVSDVTIALEPKYVTDRDFERDVYEVAIPVNFTSAKLGNSGAFTFFGGDPYNKFSQYRFYWQPGLTVSAGRIADAGGNARLAALEEQGDYWRLAPSIAAKLVLPFAAGRVSVGAGYTHRWDITQDFDHGFGSASVQYDLTSSVALTLAYRHGRKPPDFSASDEILIGIGLSQFAE